jgi:hypothetical protein
MNKLKLIGPALAVAAAVVGALALITVIPSLIAGLAVYTIAHLVFGAALGYWKATAISWASLVCVGFAGRALSA